MSESEINPGPEDVPGTRFSSRFSLGIGQKDLFLFSSFRSIFLLVLITVKREFSFCASFRRHSKARRRKIIVSKQLNEMNEVEERKKFSRREGLGF